MRPVHHAPRPRSRQSLADLLSISAMRRTLGSMSLAFAPEPAAVSRLRLLLSWRRGLVAIFSASALCAVLCSFVALAFLLTAVSAQTTWPWRVPAVAVVLAVCALVAFTLTAATALLAVVTDVRSQSAGTRAARALAEIPASEWPSVDELSGWKVAWVREDSSPVRGLTFAGIGYGAYTATAMATCAVDMPHPAPDPDCTCGFHAFTHWRRARRELRRRYRCAVLLHVEGFGAAIEHEHGWRASRQEVLTVWLRAACVACGRPTAGLRPCADVWSSACGRCAGSALRTPATLAQEWGTEVRILASGDVVPGRSRAWWWPGVHGRAA